MNNKLSCILTENYEYVIQKMIAYIVQNILEKNYKKQFQENFAKHENKGMNNYRSK